MRRGLERYAPSEGYDPGSLARSKLAQTVVGKAGIFPGDWVLDVETGEGLLGVNVGRAFTRAKVVATDASREALEKARANAATEGCADRMRFIQCLPEALPLKEEVVYFTTVGLKLQSHEEPREVLEELHRVTGYSGKVYAATVDLTRLARKPRGLHKVVFDAETIEEMRVMGFGKVQSLQVAILTDGGRLHLMMAKRFDPEAGGEEAEDEDDEEG